jgi:hypothetical protein
MVTGGGGREPEVGGQSLSIELNPQLAKGIITDVSGASVTVSVIGRLGVITVPLRWVFTDKPLQLGQTVEFYFSYMIVL